MLKYVWLDWMARIAVMLICCRGARFILGYDYEAKAVLLLGGELGPAGGHVRGHFYLPLAYRRDGIEFGVRLEGNKMPPLTSYYTFAPGKCGDFRQAGLYFSTGPALFHFFEGFSPYPDNPYLEQFEQESWS